MCKEKNFVATVFQRLSEAMAALSEVELKRLSDPNYSVEIRTIRRRTKDDAPSATNTNLDELIARLTAQATRHDAQSLLDAGFLSRKSLEPIARKLDIPIVKQDKVEELRDKIIEATVGARIRSQAIQGTGAS